MNDFRPANEFIAELEAWNAKLKANRTIRPEPKPEKPEPTVEDGSEFFACLLTGGKVGGWTRC